MSEFKAYVDSISFAAKRKKYKAVEVDAFVAKVQENVSSMEEELERLRGENAKYKATADQIVTTLLNAQTRSKEIVENASSEATTMVEEAKKEKEAHLEEMRQNDVRLNEEYQSKKDELAKNVEALVDIKNQFQKTIEKDIMVFLSKMNQLGSTEFLEQLSEEQRKSLLSAKPEEEEVKEPAEELIAEEPVAAAEEEEAPEEEQKPKIDLRDLNIDLPDDSELKSLIEELF